MDSDNGAVSTIKGRSWSIFPTFKTRCKPEQCTSGTEEGTKGNKRNVADLGGVLMEDGSGNGVPSLAGQVKRPRRTEVSIELLMDSSEDDDEPIKPDVLNWRTHPDLSDWTIEVVATDGKDAKSEYYAVHKSVVSLESKYFAKLFAPFDTTISGKSTYFSSLFAPTSATIFGKGLAVSSSRLELPGEAATLFPMLLDYMYDPSNLVFSTETAAIYYYFGQVFGMPHLRWKAKQFWTLDLSLETIASYYQQAITLNNQKLLSAVSTACARESIFLKLNTDSALLTVPHVDVWLDVVRTVGPLHSKHLSVLIALFCQKHASVVDGPIFAELLRVDLVPEIDASVAFLLLDLECTICERTALEVTTTVAMAIPNTLSSLQDRCIDALQWTWQTMDLSSTESSLLRRQSPEFLTTLFKRTLTEAQFVAVQKSDEISELLAKQTLPENAPLFSVDFG